MDTNDKKHWRFELVIWDAGGRHLPGGRFQDREVAEEEGRRLLRFGFGVELTDHAARYTEEILNAEPPQPEPHADAAVQPKGDSREGGLG